MRFAKSHDQVDSRRLWFENGVWWFRDAHNGSVFGITATMRRECYDADALAKALCMGSRSFRRLVKDSLGISPGIWLRMERAVAIRHQLREGLLIKTLSADYGFKHTGDFSDEFKRWHGVSPSKFIENHHSHRDY